MMLRMVLFVFALLAGMLAMAFALNGCSPRQPTTGEAFADVQNMNFVRHPNGLCFGVVRFQAYAGYEGTSVTHVPSEACQ